MERQDRTSTAPLSRARALAVAAVTLGALALPGGAIAASPSPSPQDDQLTTARERAQLLRAGQTSAAATTSRLGLGAAERLVVADVVVDDDGRRHVRYDRTYDGLRVLGGDLVVHQTRTGAVASVDRAAGRPIRLASTRAAVSEDRADGVARAAAERLGVNPRGVDSERVVLAARSKTVKPRLAWESVVGGQREDGTPSRLHVLTDASSGKTLASWDEIHTGSGHGNYNGWVPLNTVQVTAPVVTGPNGGEEQGSLFELRDTTRGQNTVLDRQHSYYGSGVVVTDTDDVWGDGDVASPQTSAADVAYGLATTWDYYRIVLGRNGIKDDGVGLNAYVHVGSGYRNAYWDGASGILAFGDGAANAHPLTALDVVGHEYSHGLTASTSRLQYYGESGGLNEATSDILGTAVEFAAYNGNDPGDYRVGELIDINGDGTPLRYQDQPSRDGISPDSWYDGIGGLDVHYSSGPANHFFYLLAEGSTPKEIGGILHESPTERNIVVQGIGREDAVRIWYRALTTYFTSTTDYPAARDATLRAAADLFGPESPQHHSVDRAWRAVGVNPGLSGTLPENPDYENADPMDIPDGGEAVESTIEVSGRAGNASDELKVGVAVTHTYRGDLVIDLVAPDGTTFRLKRSNGMDSADDVRRTYSVDASSIPADGTWRLRVQDMFPWDTGRLDRWSLTF